LCAENIKKLEETIKKGKHLQEIPISLCTDSFNQPSSAGTSLCGEIRNSKKPKVSFPHALQRSQTCARLSIIKRDPQKT